MAPRCAMGVMLSLVFGVGYALPERAVAANPAPYATWTLQYSGKHRLVWYFATSQNYFGNAPNWVSVDDMELVIYPGVRPPTTNGVFLLDYYRINEGEEVLDIGTGSGLHAILAAERAKRVVATDIFPPAVANAQFNAARLGIEQKVDFRAGDLFEPIASGEKFDVFFFNINFPSSPDPSARKSLHERFFSEVRQYMKPGARIYYQTSFIENLPVIYDMLERHRFRIMEMHMEYLPEYRHEPLFMMIQSLEQMESGVD